MNSAHRIDAPAFDTVWDGLGLDEEDLAAKTRRGGMGGPVGCLLDPRNPDIREMSRAIYDDLIRFLSLVEHFDLNTRIWSKR